MDNLARPVFGQLAQISLAGQAAAQPVVGVFHPALLPGGVGIAEEGADAQSVELMILGEPAAVIEGHGAAPLWGGREASIWVMAWAMGSAAFWNMGRGHDQGSSGREKTGPNPTDRGKGGVKRSLSTEAQGVPVGLAVDGANRHDMKLVQATVDSVPVTRPETGPDRPQGMCLDKGYDYDEVRQTLEDFGFTAHIRSRGEEAKAIKREAGFKARRAIRIGINTQLLWAR